jgi:hypothetical protein
MADPTLVLRDIHQVTPPAWWPPAPGWWLLAAALLVAATGVWLWRARRRRRQRRIAQLFDEAIAAEGAPSAQIAAMSGLLRRAARRRDRLADKLDGDAWLAFLDAGDARRPFTQGDGRLLLEGGFRPHADPGQVASLRVLARDRFIDWMTK